MKILITTEPDDIHAALVKITLEEAGHECLLWFTADMPTRQTNSIYFANTNYSWISEDAQSFNSMNSPFDVVWWRRPRRPFLENINSKDLSFMRKENALFHDAIPFMIANDAWWVNPFSAVLKSNSKILQLKLAPRCGLTIPSTLISNCPDKIKDFIIAHKTDGVIYKPFAPHNWYENNTLKLYYTREVELEQLPSADTLKLAPGIFQKRIKKKFELRITCFGNYLSAVKIFSQESAKGTMDWRCIPPEELKLEPYTLPATFAENIKRYMQALGIVFGCFDFIVTPNNEVYFLEVNQQGQFLWVEDCLPELQMLDKFAQFILSRSLNFEWKKSNVYMRDYESRAIEIINNNMDHHVYLNGVSQMNNAA